MKQGKECPAFNPVVSWEHDDSWSSDSHFAPLRGTREEETQELGQSSDSAGQFDIPWNHPPLEFLLLEIINFSYVGICYLQSKSILTKTQFVLKRREICQYQACQPFREIRGSLVATSLGAHRQLSLQSLPTYLLRDASLAPTFYYHSLHLPSFPSQPALLLGTRHLSHMCLLHAQQQPVL